MFALIYLLLNQRIFPPSPLSSSSPPQLRPPPSTFCSLTNHTTILLCFASAPLCLLLLLRPSIKRITYSVRRRRQRRLGFYISLLWERSLVFIRFVVTRWLETRSNWKEKECFCDRREEDYAYITISRTTTKISLGNLFLSYVYWKTKRSHRCGCQSCTDCRCWLRWSWI